MAAGKIISAITIAISAIQGFIKGQSPVITKETSRMANRVYHYSNEKICDEINYTFKPIQDTIQDTIAFGSCIPY